MADVFISYAREDRSKADQIARGLQAIGLDCFWDTEIPPGQTWADYIEGKLSQCKAVVVLWSAHSTGSQWVREEARMGRESGKLIPAMLDTTQAPFGFGEVQAANLSAWNGASNHPDWVRFANAVHLAVNGADAPMPQPAARPNPQPSFTPQPAYAAPGEAESLSPVGYIAKCFRLYVNGSGRARRAEFGWFVLFSFAVTFVAMMLDVGLFGTNPYTNAANSIAITLVVSLAMLCPFIASASRRAHDFGQSGWLAAATAIPYVGFLVALVFVFIPGQPGENKYGPNPKGV
jgi:uncharacterized membrane protein YhaH (DUF805 family)